MVEHYYIQETNQFPNLKTRVFGGKLAIPDSPDLLNPDSNVSKREGKVKVIACSLNDIKGQITPERHYSTAKNSCFTSIMKFD